MSEKDNGNKVDQFIEKSKKHPWASGLTAVFGTAALASQSIIAIGAGIISPVLTARETVVGAVNLFRERSPLSKTFSAASMATGVAAGVGYASAINAPGGEALAAFMFTSLGMIGTSALNVASHYTKDIHIGLKLTKTNKGDNQEPPAPPSL